MDNSRIFELAIQLAMPELQNLVRAGGNYEPACKEVVERYRQLLLKMRMVG